ncbi:MAG TPA: GntR family transcriptional regulator [Acidimicrobiales bacterium]|jgi:DNA-binding GntR family transcriptional regulator|nr:GntR family transcriptional regulator [Acidimicrobiales bacterium]
MEGIGDLPDAPSENSNRPRRNDDGSKRLKPAVHPSEALPSGPPDSGGSVQRAAGAIRKAILRRELPPGMQIRQADLAKQLRLSRIPVREALKVVETEGLVIHRPNSGYYVRKLSEAELTELYLMRDLLESEVLSRVSAVSPSAVEELVALNLRAELAVAAGDLHGMIEYNRTFHFSLLELGGMPIVLDEIRRLWSMSESYRVFHFVDDTTQAGTLVQHREMIDALRKGDIPRLVRLSKEHRQTGEHTVVELLRSGL